MSLELYKKIDLATRQFETAIMLFLTGGDKFSVITLAGAADVIFCQLVSRCGKENFTDYVRSNQDDSQTRQEKGKEINDTLFINALKHMDPEEDGIVKMDVEICALGAILKGLANYNMLEEKNPDLVKGFLAWVRTNLDPDRFNIYQDPSWKPKG